VTCYDILMHGWRTDTAMHPWSNFVTGTQCIVNDNDDMTGRMQCWTAVEAMVAQSVPRSW